MRVFVLRAALVVGLIVGLAVPSVIEGQPGDRGAQPTALDLLEFRNLAPHRVGSWITDIAVPEISPDQRASSADRYTFYVAARNGGVWKTENNGTTFRNITDSADIASVGDIALARQDPKLLWVGTGDAEIARSSYAGTGVYSSSDGGETFQHRGLEDSHHIARIRIDPRDSDTVYVAAMGHLFSENEQRGVFKTIDGGSNWRHVLALGSGIGVIDLLQRPDEPDVLIAAAYDKVRLPWHFEAGGEGSALYRSDDAGESWRRLAAGFPSGKIGRIGVDHCRFDPDQVYAIVENLNLRPPGPAVSERADSADEGSEEPEIFGNEVYRSSDGGESWRQVSPDGLSIGSKSAYAFNEVRVDPVDCERLYVTSETLISSVDGGKSWRDVRWPQRELFSEIFGDVRTLWIDPYDGERLLLGSDGGVFASWDGGKTSDHFHNLPLGEVYAVTVDLEAPYNLYVGLQDHEAWRGPVSSWSGAVTLEDWTVVGRWDGMVGQVDPEGRYYYGTTQFGGHIRTDMDRGTRVEIVPRAAEDDAEYRFTWTTPLLLSPHSPAVLFTGSQKVLRSDDRGESWLEISADLTDNDPAKIEGKGHIRYNTITTISESRFERGELWVGTDDGRLWHGTETHGDADGKRWQWRERTDALVAAGAPRQRWVSRVVASRHDEGQIFVSKSGYRRDDFTPYLYVSSDRGRSFRAIVEGLPQAPISVVAEDPGDPDLLFVGHDRGAHVSFDRGVSWQPVPGLPVVPVRDLLIHPRDGDLVVGTYGRGVFVADMHFLRRLPAAMRGSDPALSSRLFEVEPGPVDLDERAGWGDYNLYGKRRIELPNPQPGLEIFYVLSEGVSEVVLVLETAQGQELTRRELDPEPGFHRHRVQTRMAARSEEPGEEDAETKAAEKDRWPTVRAGPGVVKVRLLVDGEVSERLTELRPRPRTPVRSRVNR